MEKIINLENALEKDFSKYNVRETARAVLFDENNKIAVINISKEGYYQLVGGGIDDGESIEDGLRRECLEEAGAKIKIISKLCTVKEIKKVSNQIQISHCFIAKVFGKKGKPKFTKEEIEERGFKSEWIDIDKLINLIKKQGFGSVLGRYSHERDLEILKQFKILNKK